MKTAKRPEDVMELLKASDILDMVVPSTEDHRLLALISISVALKAIRSGDVTAAGLFIEDAQAHLREMATCNSD